MENIDMVQKERDRKVMVIVHNFLLAAHNFRQQYEKYQQGSLHFIDVAKLVDDRGESIFYALKESCQELFRRNYAFLSETEQIFDLTVGSIFHLAMKLREDLYQLEIYGPKYKSLLEKGGGRPEQKNLVHQFNEIISRAETSLKEGMEEIALLIEDISRQFKELLFDHRQNGLLIRFLLEEKVLVEEVMGKGAVGDIFKTLYGQDEAQPYRLAGESYFQSAFYNLAIKNFSLALGKNPGDENLQFKMYLSQGLEQFYSFAPHQALKSFEKCLSLTGKVIFLESYRAMIDKVCHKIQEEFPGRRKSDQHRDLVKIAKTLQKQLQELPPVPSGPSPA